MPFTIFKIKYYFIFAIYIYKLFALSVFFDNIKLEYLVLNSCKSEKVSLA